MTQERDVQKIAFVGTSSIGKTELLNQLKRKYKGNNDFGFVPEAARYYFHFHPEVSEEERFSARIQGEVQDLQWVYEKQAEANGHTTIFCDRSVLDAIVYSRAHGDKASEELFTKVASWISTYHRILLLNPADVPYETDDIRKETEEVRRKNHEAFVEFFAEKGIEYELLSGTVEQRLDRISQLISS